MYLRPCHELVIVASKADYQIAGKTSAWPDEQIYDFLKDAWAIRPVRPKDSKEPPPFPKDLVSRLILLYSSRGDLVLDPFAGTGTVSEIARRLWRHVWMIEREAKYRPPLEAVLNQAVLPEPKEDQSAKAPHSEPKLVQARLPKAA